MDGENTNMYRDHIHARSPDSKHHSSRSLIKARWGQISHLIPDTWQICGENLYAKHNIHYTGPLALKDYFYVFGVFDHAHALWLSWDEVQYAADELGFPTVPRIYPMINDVRYLRQANFLKDYPEHEGYVVHIADEFPECEFSTNVAKWVRANHVQTGEHWMNQPMVPNEIS